MLGENLKGREMLGLGGGESIEFDLCCICYVVCGTGKLNRGARRGTDERGMCRGENVLGE